jgi:hypothetical protein
MELMLLPPRIRLLLCREYNESPRPVPAMLALRLSIHARTDLNVTLEAIFGAVQQPFSCEFLSSDSADLSFTGAQRNGCND